MKSICVYIEAKKWIERSGGLSYSFASKLQRDIVWYICSSELMNQECKGWKWLKMSCFKSVCGSMSILFSLLVYNMILHKQKGLKWGEESFVRQNLWLWHWNNQSVYFFSLNLSGFSSHQLLQNFNGYWDVIFLCFLQA